MTFPHGEHPVRDVFVEIVPPEKLVWTESVPPSIDRGEVHDPNEVTVTTLFEEQGDKTKLTMLILHDSAEHLKRNEEGGMRYGWVSNFESLEAFLEELAAV